MDWEYKTSIIKRGMLLSSDKLDRRALEKALNEAGAAGWELVNFDPHKVDLAGEKDAYLMVFKRLKQ